jgi:hypothetical protein
VAANLRLTVKRKTIGFVLLAAGQNIGIFRMLDLG